MYNCKYKKCCCQQNYNSDIIETACSNCGIKADYYSANNDNDDCGCGFDEAPSVFPANPMFGQSYVPIQTMNQTFTPSVGLKMGTIFPELVNPYSPCQSLEENAFIEATNTIWEGCNKC